MKVIADICVIPIGVGVSVAEYVAVCQTIFTEANLNPQLHGYGTNGNCSPQQKSLIEKHYKQHQLSQQKYKPCDLA